MHLQTPLIPLLIDPELHKWCLGVQSIIESNMSTVSGLETKIAELNVDIRELKDRNSKMSKEFQELQKKYNKTRSRKNSDTSK